MRITPERVAEIRARVEDVEARPPMWIHGTDGPKMVPRWMSIATATMADLLDERDRLLAVVEAADAMEAVRLESGAWDRARTTRHIHATTDFRAAVRAYRTGEGQ